MYLNRENLVLKIEKYAGTLLFVGIVFLALQLALAYNQFSTHPALTVEMAQLFNSQNSVPERKLSRQDIQSMVKGSIEEDAVPRWINHFYDPIHNKGWTGNHFGDLDRVTGYLRGADIAPKPAIASINWVQNQEYQAAYGRQFGNQTWQKAIASYLDGDKESAFLALGHVLHLIEDASVPDHTRDDSHPGVENDPGSPYEDYAKAFTDVNNLTVADLLINTKTKTPKFSDISSVFNLMALYSNNNFFSEDTISNEEYGLPDLKTVEKLVTIVDGEKLFLIKKSGIYLAFKPYEYVNNYSIREKSFVLPSYRDHLFPKVVSVGAGVVDLFFKEVEAYRSGAKILPPIISDSDTPILDSIWPGIKGTIIESYEKGKSIITGDRAAVDIGLQSLANALNKFGSGIDAAAKKISNLVEDSIQSAVNLDQKINDNLIDKLLALFSQSSVVHLPLLFTPPLGHLSSPPNLVGALQIPLAALEQILKNSPASLSLGSDASGAPALLIDHNDSILASLQPYLTPANSADLSAQAIQRMAILAKEAGEKTNAVIAQSNQLASEALAGVAQATVSQMKAANQEAFNQSIERFISGYGSQFKTKAEADAAKWPWDTFYNRPYIMPQTSVISVQDAIPDGAYVRLSGNSQLYQKNGHRLSPVFGGDATNAVTVPFRAQEWNSSGNVVGPWYGIFLNNLRPVELRSPNYWGGMIFYQNQTTGKLYNDPNGWEPLSAGYVRNLEINGYLPRRVNTYEEDLNDTVTPRVVHGRRITAGQAMDEAIRDGAGRSASNAATDTIGNPPSLLDRALGWIADAYQHIKDAVISVIDKVVSVVEKIGKIIVNATRSVAKAVVAGAKAIVNAVVAMGETAAKAMDAVLALPGQALDWVKGKVASAAPMVAGAYRQVVGGIGSVLGRLGW